MPRASRTLCRPMFEGEAESRQTMNAFAAAEQSGRAADLHEELNALFESQNKSEIANETRIPATFLKVTVKKPT